MRIKTYSSDLSAKSWQVIKNILPVKRKSKWNLHEIINAIFYLTKNGCVRRDIPGEFLPWQMVYRYHRKWVKDGTWNHINRLLIANKLDGRKGLAA